MSMTIMSRLRGVGQCVAAARVLIGAGPVQTTHLSGVSRTQSTWGAPPASAIFQASNVWHGVRHMCSDISSLPEFTDPDAKKAFNKLLATNWSKIEKQVSDDVEAAIARSGGDGGVLASVWSSARASEKFADTLIALRMELDELSGSGGEDVRRLPDLLIAGLDSVFTKYYTYLAAIDTESEAFLKKKVENDLGSLLVQIRQRCSGLDPKWGNVTLLGTSGLSGSYIERRSST